MFVEQVRKRFELPISNEIKIRDYEINDTDSKKIKRTNRKIRSNKLSSPITKSKLIRPNENATKIKNALITTEKRATIYCSSDDSLGNKEVSHSESRVSLTNKKKLSKNEEIVKEPMNYQFVENSNNSVKKQAIGEIVCVPNEHTLFTTKNCYVKVDILDLSKYCVIGGNSFMTQGDKLVKNNISVNTKTGSKIIDKVQDSETICKSNTFYPQQNTHNDKRLTPDSKIVVEEQHLKNIKDPHFDNQIGQNNITGNKSADKKHNDYEVIKIKQKPVHKQTKSSIIAKSMFAWKEIVDPNSFEIRSKLFKQSLEKSNTNGNNIFRMKFENTQTHVKDLMGKENIKKTRGRPRKRNVLVNNTQPNLKIIQTKKPRGRPRKRNVQENNIQHNLKVEQTKKNVPLSKKTVDHNNLQSNTKAIGTITNEDVDTQEKQPNNLILNKEIGCLKRNSQSCASDTLVKKPKISRGGNVPRKRVTRSSQYLSKTVLPASKNVHSKSPVQKLKKGVQFKMIKKYSQLKHVQFKVQNKSAKNQSSIISNGDLDIQQTDKFKCRSPSKPSQYVENQISFSDSKQHSSVIKPLTSVKDIHKYQRNSSTDFHSPHKGRITRSSQSSNRNTSNTSKNTYIKKATVKSQQTSRSKYFNAKENVNTTSIQKSVQCDKIKSKGKLKQVQFKNKNSLDTAKHSNIKHITQNEKHVLNPSNLNKHSTKRNILTKSELTKAHHLNILSMSRKFSHYKRGTYLAGILKTFKRKISLYKHVYLNTYYNNKPLTVTKPVCKNQSNPQEEISLNKEAVIINDGNVKLLQEIKASVAVEVPNISSKLAKTRSSKHVPTTRTPVSRENISKQINWNTSQSQGNINTPSDNIVKEVVYVHPSYTNSTLVSGLPNVMPPLTPLHMTQYPTAITVPSAFFVYSPWNKPLNSNILEQQSSHVYLPLSQNSISTSNVVNKNYDLMNQKCCKNMQREAEVYDIPINNNHQSALNVNPQGSYVTCNAIPENEVMNDIQSTQTISNECVYSNTKYKKSATPGTFNTLLQFNCNRESNRLIPSRKRVSNSTAAIFPSDTGEFQVPELNLSNEADEQNLLHSKGKVCCNENIELNSFTSLFDEDQESLIENQFNKSTFSSEVLTSQSDQTLEIDQFNIFERKENANNTVEHMKTPSDVFEQTLVNSKKIMKYMNHLKDLKRSHMIKIKKNSENNVVHSNSTNVHEFDTSCPGPENNRAEEETIFPLPIITDTFTIIE